MNEVERKRALDRIQKCLRLSASSNPHEAAAALRQAQALMRQHGISEDDLAVAEVSNMVYYSPEPWKVKMPMYLSRIVALIQKAFGVVALYSPYEHQSGYRTAIRYFGTNGRGEIAAWTHHVIWRALWSSWSEHLKDNPQFHNVRGARTGYWLGWLSQVSATVMAFGGAKEEERPKTDGSGTELVPTQWGHEIAKIERALSAFCPDAEEVNPNKMKINGSAHQSGAEAAKDFQLHRPVTGASQRQLGNN